MVKQGEQGPSLREELQARAGFRQRFSQIQEKFPDTEGIRGAVFRTVVRLNVGARR
jgi:hypothetical protein